MNKGIKLLFGLATAGIVVWSYLAPDAIEFQVPQLARIFFYHFPCPLVVTWFLAAGAYFGIRYLRSPERHWDMRAVAANELGFLFSLLVMATGMLFSKVQWNAWWQWDPRQTSFLLVIVIEMAYFVLRAGYADPDKRAAYSAAYAAGAFLPNMFLIYVFPHLPYIEAGSFHPSDTILKGLLDADYTRVVVCTIAVMFTLAFWLYRMTVRAGLLELALEEIDGLEAVRGGAPPSGVVRPVSVSHES